MPTFSVVIPTRNRANILKYAIRSVLNQDFDDYELVISDNDSSDSTCDVVKSFDNQKIRYVNPGRFLSVSDHWTFAVKHSRGDYIWVLGDDDCLSPYALSAIKDEIDKRHPKMIWCRHIKYYGPECVMERLRNSILFEVRKLHGNAQELKSDDMLKSWFGLDSPQNFPHPSVVCISAVVVSQILDELGAFFFQPFPEYTAFPLALTYIEKVTILDKLLVVLGSGVQAVNARDEVTRDGEFAEPLSYKIARTPLKGKYFINAMAESYSVAKELRPRKLKNIEISMEMYFIHYYRSMLVHKRIGHDVNADMKEFKLSLSNLPKSQKRRITNEIRMTQLVEIIKRIPLSKIVAMLQSKYYLFGNRINSIFGNRIQIPNKILGDDNGIGNILDCVAKLETIETKINQMVK